MSNTERWLKEYEEELEKKTIQDAEIRLNAIFEDMLKEERVILTSRIKSLKSLKEKIKRNRLDNDVNKDKSIFEILEDNIGIRIICKKNCDEEKVNDIIFNQIDSLRTNHKIVFIDDLLSQPSYQKNGHEIYKVKGIFEGLVKFELQVKSLSNLFWGEMEHPLIYKNNKYMIKQSYYKKEMDSIFKELHTIDHKLEYMENSMMSEDMNSLIDEKKDIVRRMLYLNFKDCFYYIHDEYLNNNHIYEAVSNFLFKPYKIKKSTQNTQINEYYNTVLLNSMSFILDSTKNKIDLTRFNINILDDMDFHFENKKIEEGILNNVRALENGWWYFILLIALIKYNEKLSGDTDILTLSSEILKQEIFQCIEEIYFVIYGKIVMPTLNLFANSQDIIMTKLAEQVSLTLLKIMSDERFISFTDESIAKDMSIIYKEVIVYLRDNAILKNVDYESNTDFFNEISFSIGKCMISVIYEKTNIRQFLEKINSNVEKISTKPLPLSNDLLKEQKIISTSDLIKYINKKR